jgi:hypothetical protein
MNEAITTDLLRTLLLMSSEDSFTQDVVRRTAVEYGCSLLTNAVICLWH